MRDAAYCTMVTRGEAPMRHSWPRNQHPCTAFASNKVPRPSTRGKRETVPGEYLVNNNFRNPFSCARKPVSFETSAVCQHEHLAS